MRKVSHTQAPQPSLSGEQERWKTQAGQLRGDLAKLPMKMLLAAGFATYLAKTPEDVRADMITSWQAITGVTGFSFKRVMSTESELLLWKGMGLPSDDLSQENSLVIAGASSERVPFVIDPASACTDWLRRFLGNDKNRPLEVVTHHDARFSNQVRLLPRLDAPRRPHVQASQPLLPGRIGTRRGPAWMVVLTAARPRDTHNAPTHRHRHDPLKK